MVELFKINEKVFYPFLLISNHYNKNIDKK